MKIKVAHYPYCIVCSNKKRTSLRKANPEYYRNKARIQEARKSTLTRSTLKGARFFKRLNTIFNAANQLGQLEIIMKNKPNKRTIITTPNPKWLKNLPDPKDTEAVISDLRICEDGAEGYLRRAGAIFSMIEGDKDLRGMVASKTKFSVGLQQRLLDFHRAQLDFALWFDERPGAQRLLQMPVSVIQQAQNQRIFDVVQELPSGETQTIPMPLDDILSNERISAQVFKPTARAIALPPQQMEELTEKRERAKKREKRWEIDTNRETIRFNRSPEFTWSDFAKFYEEHFKPLLADPAKIEGALKKNQIKKPGK